MLLPYSTSSLTILITSVLNSASDRLTISICLVLFLGFCSVLSFEPYFFVSLVWQPPCVHFCVLGRAALSLCFSTSVKLYGAEQWVFTRWGNPLYFVALYVGKGPKRGQCFCCLLEAYSALVPFPVTSLPSLCDWHHL